ncbi:MAG TPA: heme NO-binding domain-containing protein [Sphingomicrobium sp.]|nr:heme NO-binding domain-containing protein [Sphingomicrobium sp.]
MKGLVFTTFYRHCESRYGADFLDDLIEEAALPNQGAYTSVGSYPFEEMVALVTALASKTGTPMPVILREFGEFCFLQWVRYVPAHFDGKQLFDIMAGIDGFHENEVRKLYPDAELPSFKVESRDGDRMILRYHSCKPLADLAVGVIHGAANYLGETVEVHHQPMAEPRGPYVRIEINRVS